MGNTSEFLVDYRSSEYLSYGGPTSTWEAKSSYNYSFPAPEIIKHTTERFLYFPLLTRAHFYGSKCSHAFSRDRRPGLAPAVTRKCVTGGYRVKRIFSNSLYLTSNDLNGGQNGGQIENS